jgi:hypothetical protein
LNSRILTFSKDSTDTSALEMQQSQSKLDFERAPIAQGRILGFQGLPP